MEVNMGLIEVLGAYHLPRCVFNLNCRRKCSIRLAWSSLWHKRSCWHILIDFDFTCFLLCRKETQWRDPVNFSQKKHLRMKSRSIVPDVWLGISSNPHAPWVIWVVCMECIMHRIYIHVTGTKSLTCHVAMFPGKLWPAHRKWWYIYRQEGLSQQNCWLILASSWVQTKFIHQIY